MITIKQAAEQLGISTSRLQLLCKQGRVRNAKLIGRVWILPNSPKVTPGKRGPKLTV